MKKLVLLVVVLLAASTWAKSYPDNPDRRPSLSINLGYRTGSGKYTVSDGSGASINQDLLPDYFGTSATFISPLSNSSSIILRADYSSSKTVGKANDFFYRSKSEYKMMYFNVGLKIYFGR